MIKSILLCVSLLSVSVYAADNEPKPNPKHELAEHQKKFLKEQKEKQRKYKECMKGRAGAVAPMFRGIFNNC